MLNASKQIKNITAESFEKYGVILDFTPDFEGSFEILVREPEKPWRMAVYRPTDRVCSFLENHPDSLESFEPQRGVSLLIVAVNDSPNDYEVFVLDKPVCLYKSIWHNSIALTDDVLIRVNENLEVECEFHHFDKNLEIQCVSV